MSTAPGPDGGSSLLAAARWLEALVQGPAATMLAVLAVAATGLMMLSGRLPVRRGLVVTLGCFILFGAPVIARGIVGSAIAIGDQEPVASPPPVDFTPPAFSPSPQSEPPIKTDPYAGASIRR